MKTHVKSRLYTPDIAVEDTPDIPYGKGRRMVPQLVTVCYLQVEMRPWFVMWVEVAGQRRDLATGGISSESHTHEYAGAKESCPDWVWQIAEEHRPAAP